MLIVQIVSAVKMLTLLFYSLWLGGLTTTLYNRVPKDIAIGPSHKPRCNHCSATLKTRHVFPIISYICLLGKCYNCKIKIPVSYLLVELVAFTLVIGLYLQHSIFDNIFIANSLLLVYLNVLIFIYIDHKKIKSSLIFALLSLLIFNEWQNHAILDFVNAATKICLAYFTIANLDRIVNVNLDIQRLYVIICSFLPSYLIVVMLLSLAFVVLIAKMKKKLNSRYIKLMPDILALSLLVVKIAHIYLSL